MFAALALVKGNSHSAENPVVHLKKSNKHQCNLSHSNNTLQEWQVMQNSVRDLSAFFRDDKSTTVSNTNKPNREETSRAWSTFPQHDILIPPTEENIFNKQRLRTKNENWMPNCQETIETRKSSTNETQTISSSAYTPFRPNDSAWGGSQDQRVERHV